jgi:hypothetical protein
VTTSGSARSIIWSDHGEGLPRGKRWPYDAGIRIPLIVRWPGAIDRGTVSERLVSLLDLAPTLLSLAGLPRPCHFHGQPFIGPQAGDERRYIHAARDRHDEAYDMVRAVRDRRFKYMRNFSPEKPYLLWIPYRNRHPVIQELWRLHAADELESPRDILMQSCRPPEELYDTETDPFEIRNLANDPAHAATLARLRTEMNSWRRDVGDQGDLPEDEMVEKMWPGGEQPVTAAPLGMPISAAHCAQRSVQDGETLPAPVLLQLHSATQGASIGYTLDDGDDPSWQLYHEPLRFEAGAHTIRTKAIRIGYRESDERRIALTVE